MFQHKVYVTAMNSEKIVNLGIYSGDMRKLKDHVTKLFPGWEDIFYSHVTSDPTDNRFGHIIRR